MENSIHIEYIQEHHFEDWLPLWNAYQIFYKTDLGPEVTAHTWQRFFDDSSPIRCIVAKQGEKIIGFAHFLIHPSTWSTQDFCYLEDLFVLPDVRGQHVGKALIAYIQDFAQEHHCSRVYWHTQNSNHTAQRLYDWIAEKPGMMKYLIDLNK